MLATAARSKALSQYIPQPHGNKKWDFLEPIGNYMANTWAHLGVTASLGSGWLHLDVLPQEGACLACNQDVAEDFDATLGLLLTERSFAVLPALEFFVATNPYCLGWNSKSLYSRCFALIFIQHSQHCFDLEVLSLFKENPAIKQHLLPKACHHSWNIGC